MRKYKLNLPTEAVKLIKPTDVTPWASFITDKNKDRCPAEGLDLLSKMLVYDKNLRITPAQAMEHPFFAPIHKLMQQSWVN